MASEIARRDLARHGIRVVTVYPGPVHSALERAGRSGYQGGDRGIAKLVPTGHPESLADRIRQQAGQRQADDAPALGQIEEPAHGAAVA